MWSKPCKFLGAVIRLLNNWVRGNWRSGQKLNLHRDKRGSDSCEKLTKGTTSSYFISTSYERFGKLIIPSVPLMQTCRKHFFLWRRKKRVQIQDNEIVMSFLCLQSSCSQLVHLLSSLWVPRLVFRSNHYLPQFLQTLIPHSFIYCQSSTNGTILRKCLSFLASIYIQEHILLLFTICTPAYLSVTVVLKHSLYIICKLWIQQLDLHLLSSFMGQCQYRITSHKQACLHMVGNNTTDKYNTF